MKKSILSLILAVVMSFGSTQGVISAFAEAKRNEDTPVAEIATNENNSSKSNTSFTDKNSSSFVGIDSNYFEVYNSEEEYIQTQNEAKDLSTYGIETTSEQVKQVITVMTTATGSKSNGNYVESKPIANAIVRINGIPRYTDCKGQISVILEKNSYVELFIEKSGFNPYIEVISITGEEKIVHLKMPSDDIDVYAVMLEYADDYFNVILQDAHILKGYNDDYSELTISANIEAEAYLFYVNGEIEKLSVDGTIDLIDFNSYNSNDKFEIQLYYDGIYSKLIQLQIYIDEFNAKELKEQIAQDLKTTSANNASCEAGGNGSGVDIGAINLPVETVIAALTQLIIPKDISISIGDFSIDISFYVDSFKGTLEFMVGVSYETDIKDAIANRLKHKNLKKDEYKKRRKEETQQVENEAIEAQKEIQKFNKEISESKNNKEESKAKLKEAKKRYDEAKKKYIPHSANCQKERQEFRDARREYNKAESSYKKNYKSLCDTVKNNKLDSKSTNSLLSYLKNGKGLKQKAAMLEDFFSGGPKNATGKGSFSVNLEISLVGFVEYSYRNKVIVDSGLRGEVALKPSYTYQGFAPVGPVVIPFYVKLELTIGAEFKFISNSTDSPFAPVDFFDWFYGIVVAFNVGVRVDGGVGLAGIASVGIYGKVNFKFTVTPKDQSGGEFSWGAGLKIQFLIFEEEFGYESIPKKLYGIGTDNESVDTYSLMPRSLSSNDKVSDAELYDGVYQLSQPILLPFNNKQILLWLADDEKRDEYNRSVLKFSIFDGVEWSEPKNVFENSYSDYSFDASIYNEKVIIAAQRITKHIDANTDLNSMLAANEIFVATFNDDASAFTEFKQITNNEYMNTNPKLVNTDNNISLLWRSNSKNDYFGLTGINSINICKNIFTNSSNEVILSTSDIISNYSVASKDNELYLAVQVDSDCDFATPGYDICIYKNGIIDSKIDNAESPNLVSFRNDISLIYYQNGSIMESKNLESMSTIIKKDTAPDFTVNTNQNNITVFFAESDDICEQGYCAVYNGDKWTCDIKVTNEQNNKNNVGQIYGYTLDNCIYTVYSISDENSNMVVCFTQKLMIYEMEATIEIYEDLSGAEANSLSISLINTGDYMIHRIRVALEDYCNVIEPNEPIGVGKAYEVIIHLPKTINIYGEHIVQLDVLSNNDAVVLTKSCNIYLCENNIEVAFEQTILDGKQHFMVNLYNDSVINAFGEIYVYVNGQLHEIIDFEVKANKSITKDIALKNINYQDNIYFIVKSGVGDKTTFDNTASFFSWQDEYLQQEFENKYKDVLDNSKLLLGV